MYVLRGILNWIVFLADAINEGREGFYFRIRDLHRICFVVNGNQ